MFLLTQQALDTVYLLIFLKLVFSSQLSTFPDRPLETAPSVPGLLVFKRKGYHIIESKWAILYLHFNWEKSLNSLVWATCSGLLAPQQQKDRRSEALICHTNT
ncbi:hypothetical protein CMV_015997 [Castanea mollissima]|uniref:Uncharacterized protein n=1 Tax=Castanea mollissima TaxID=60419 RepID=A0A8J4QUE7_9ROSI|nr:hypothetical protein CMV_015997 [Castanea mollissima]